MSAHILWVPRRGVNSTRPGERVTYALASIWLAERGTHIDQRTWEALHDGDQGVVDEHPDELAAIADYYEVVQSYLVGPDDETTDRVDAALEYTRVERTHGITFVQVCTKGGLGVGVDELRAITAEINRVAEQQREHHSA
ncbi:hypothetical protein [Curtobacterium sp. VKM Ac-1376]|uniref:hypothetical protein n=1 Tax=Curtobacterium sp. VKM Ac-1376 TaxID=123312 RepID=UPI00188BC178|nr:hypothetical protein [Curtobacterium sp. VKM Ac-1376]MBF4616313.1 hypothetical protein [Curtobacterium sp. VKM Ac-1376]